MYGVIVNSVYMYGLGDSRSGGIQGVTETTSFVKHTLEHMGAKVGDM